MSTIQFDFDSIKQRILTNLSSKSEWANFANYGVADCLIDGIVQEMAYQMQYNEYLTYENWWTKARNKSSLLVQSAVHGYVVPRKQGAIGNLIVSTDENFENSYGTDIIIPKYFQFSGNDIFFVSDKAYNFSASENYVKIGCKQGEAKSVKFLAMGNLYEEKFIEDADVDNSMYDLYVNGIAWERVDSLFECEPTDKVYELVTKSDLSGVTIKFGNNIYGQKLMINDVVEFKYIATKGADGNIYSSGIITNVETQAFDINGKPVKLYVKNESSLIGGKDYPTIDEIRQLSPRVYQAGNRASSTEDYETLIKQFAYISKVNVWGAYEINKDNGYDPWTFIPSSENVVHLALLDSIYNNLTDDEKNQVIEDIHSKNDPTDIVQFETVEKIPLIFDVNAVVLNSSYVLSQVRSDIETTLVDNYSIENMNFNENIYESDFIRLIDEVNGVDHHTSYIYSEKTCETNPSEPQIFQFSIPLHPISNTKTTCYIKEKGADDDTYQLFATVDSNGYLISANTDIWDISGSIIYLSTGNVSIKFNNADFDTTKEYVVKVRYGLTTNNIILNSRKDILMYKESTIKVSYE